MAVEVWANAATGIVTAGGTNAPAPGTQQTWTVNVSAAFAVASTVASPQTHFFAADPAAPGEVFDVTVAPGGTGSQSWTVTRGADGTTPTTHALNFQVIQATARATLQVLARPWLVRPSGDLTGAADVTAFAGAFAGTGTVEVVPGATYTVNATTVANENQYLISPGKQAAVVNLAVTGIAAFQWKQANPAVYNVNAGGGIRGALTVVGKSGTVNPADGSIGVQMADIPHLECEIQVINCQNGFLSSNQNFFTEQGRFTVWTKGCKNPIVLQTAASGGAGRTGSFDRCEITWYANETLDGNFGLGGVQLLAGAQLEGGKLRQYGNFGGTGQAGVYGLYVSGAAPAGPTGFSSIVSAEVTKALEYDGSGTKPGTILIAASSSITPAWGSLDYGLNFGPASISGPWAYSGPITGDNTLLTALWTTKSSGFPAGWSGTVRFRGAGNLTGLFANASGDQVALDIPLAIVANTTITSGSTIFTLPSGFFPPSNKEILITYQPFGATPQTVFLQVGTGGAVTWTGATVTTPAGGTSFLTGDASYPVMF